MRGTFFNKLDSLSFVATMAAIAVLLTPSFAHAQQIGGSITDEQGLALPGVVVEAQSPSLIEGIRTVTSDGAGRYSIVALEPGTYSVTFTLPGFSTLIRDGVSLTTGFSANIDAQLTVGTLDESVTVSGASPVVDIQNNLQRAVIDREVIDTVPTGKSFQSYALLTPGMTQSSSFGTSLNQDSGGTTNQTVGALSIHGGRPKDGTTALNGLDVSNAFSGGAGQMFGLVSDGGMEEMSIEIAGHNAEAQYGGVQVNLIPRAGGNQFSGAFFGSISDPYMQFNNLDDDLLGRGATNYPLLDDAWLMNPAFGGPIIENKLWFFAQHTAQVADVFTPGVYEAVNAANSMYIPDTSRPVASENSSYDTSINVTYQATSKDKIKLYYSWANWLKPNALAGPLFTLFIAPEAAVQGNYKLGTTQVGWVRPATNNLLFEADVSLAPANFDVSHTPGAVNSQVSLLEATSFTIHRNNHFISQGNGYVSSRETNSFRGSMTYVSGTHNIKVGVNGSMFKEAFPEYYSESGWTDAIAIMGLPLQANFWIPNRSINQGNHWGFYAQDQMTFDRLTVNAGLRIDMLNNSYPDQFRTPSRWEPDGLQISGNDSVVGWKDIQPRLGMAYDLFGDGRTAVKMSANRYGTRANSEWAVLVNPGSGTLGRTTSRLWFDGAPGHPYAGIPPVMPMCIGDVDCVAGDGIVQGDALNPMPNGEILSPNANAAFGAVVQTQFLDSDWSHGMGERFSNWEITAGVQHQLTDGVALDITYFRRDFINFALQNDRALSGADYDMATIDLSDRGIPGVGHVTVPELKADAVGRTPDVLFTGANQFGGESQTFNGVDVTVNARLDDLLLQGGIATGTLSSDYCGVYNAEPDHIGRRGDIVRGTNTLAQEFCSTATPWLTQIKLLATYTLPWDVQVSGTLQSIPGPERQALVTVSLAEVQAALGRPSATGIAPQVNALEPGTEYGERMNQFDLRFAKNVSIGDTNLKGMFDIYNLFNNNAVFTESYALGNYLTPLAFMPPRLFRVAVQYDF